MLYYYAMTWSSKECLRGGWVVARRTADIDYLEHTLKLS